MKTAASAAIEIRSLAAKLVSEAEPSPSTAPIGGTVGGEHGVDREVIQLLQLAWCEAVRAEWQHWLDAGTPELRERHAIGMELMRSQGYSEAMGDPVCGAPGIEPMIAIVDGKKAICFDYTMNQATPLSAIYTAKVSEVMDAAARVAEKAKEEAK